MYATILAAVFAAIHKFCHEMACLFIKEIIELIINLKLILMHLAMACIACICTSNMCYHICNLLNCEFQIKTWRGEGREGGNPSENLFDSLGIMKFGSL